MISRQMEKRQIELEYISMKDNAIMASLLIVIFVLLMICKTSELDLCTPEWWKFNVISAIACVMFYLFFDWMHSFILETVFMQREEMELELEKLNTDKPIKVIPKTVDPFDFEINKSKGTYLARFKNLKKEGFTAPEKTRTKK